MKSGRILFFSSLFFIPRELDSHRDLCEVKRRSLAVWQASDGGPRSLNAHVFFFLPVCYVLWDNNALLAAEFALIQGE